MTTTLTDPPLTSAEVLAILTDARTWPRCPNCGRPTLAALPADSTVEVP